MRVLYLNHTGRVSGGELSLLDLIRELPADIDVTVASPIGELARRAEAAGLSHSAVTGTDGSLRLHAVQTPKAIAEVGQAAIEVRRLCRRLAPDLVHANSIRAGVIANIATLGRGAPVITHVRDCLPPAPSSRAVLRFVGNRSAAIIANSEYTRARLPPTGGQGRTEVIHSAVDLTGFEPGRVDRAALRRRLGLDVETTVLGVVAQLTPWKGQLEAIETLELLRRRGLEAKLILVGSTRFVTHATRYDNTAYAARIHARIEELGLAEHVTLLGHVDDVASIMPCFDVSMVPSWEEPMGRTVLEAMALELPVIATSVGGPRELIADGVHGLLVPPRRPDLWADAVVELVAAPADRRARMGAAARERALEISDAQLQATRLTRLYHQLTTPGSSR